MKVISFDGNVFTGKSTIVRELSELFGATAVLEHSFFLEGIPKESTYGSDFINIQERYLKVDSIRKRCLGKGVNLLDRSFLSLAAHVYALNILQIADIRDDFLQLFSVYLEKDKLIVPDMFVMVRCSHGIAKRRFCDGYREKGTEGIYISKNYFFAVDDFNSKWSLSVGAYEVKTDHDVSILQMRDLYNELSISTKKKIRVVDIQEKVRKCLAD